MKTQIIRPQELAKDIIIFDGRSKSGKTLIAPLVSTFERAELWLIDHIFECLCALDHRGFIERHGAAALVRLYADLGLYNRLIGRCQICELLTAKARRRI